MAFGKATQEDTEQHSWHRSDTQCQYELAFPNRLLVHPCYVKGQKTGGADSSYCAGQSNP
jgi:hypothetical protein